MKKKALLLTSIGVLSCTFAVTALAVGGANQLDAFPVKANPIEYSVTFDGSESTTVQEIDDNYAICTTTAGGNKVGVVGFFNGGVLNLQGRFLHEPLPLRLLRRIGWGRRL